jgi:molybdenum cofactor cytidylyltransferase
MQFGEIATKDAVGAILAHSVKHAGGVFKKGRVLSAADLAALAGSGVATVFAARLSPDDVGEDEAAAAIAKVVGGPGTVAQAPFTGRANLHATTAGLAVLDGERLRALNRLHESLTIATVASHAVVDERQMVATVKVIPFAVPRMVLEQALRIIADRPLVHVEGFKHCRVGLVITRLPQTKPSLVVKSEEAMRERVKALHGELAGVRIVDHRIADVTAAVAELKAMGCSPILLFGASAIVDRGDVIPAALAAAGGDVIHLGMPVDPGNLMMYGRLAGVPVIGVPSCARSPKVNGFDWVLERVMAGVSVTREDIMDMGAGGLLAEIPTRPAPREGKPKVQRAPRIVGLVLAAGRSTRMGANKMLADFRGRPLIRATVERALGFGLDRLVVVTGHQAGAVGAALAGLAVTVVHNAAFASGLASSLKRGVEAAGDADAALVFLGDMPLIDAETVKRMIAAFNPAEHRSIVVPSHKDVRGHPVLWGQAQFPAIATLTGDQGAKPLIAQFSEDVVDIDTANEGVLLDADTPDALERLRAAAG